MTGPLIAPKGVVVPYGDLLLKSYLFAVGKIGEYDRRGEAVSLDKNFYTINPPRDDVSFVGLARLDKKFKVAEKSIQLLNIVSYGSQFSLTAEDARLLTFGNRIFIFFNDLPPAGNRGHCAIYFGELIEKDGVFVMKEEAKPFIYPLAIHTEKNWSPFFYNERLYLIYSDQPRVILEADLEMGVCQEAARGRSKWNWNLGEIRGGTPAYLVDGAFLTFFHSCFPAKTSKGRVYFMGAYTFEAQPPFSEQMISPRPLGNLTDYTEENSFKVVFPGGAVIEDRLIHVAWGKCDKQIYITSFDKEKLLSSIRSIDPY